MAVETVDEPVSVIASFNVNRRGNAVAKPEIMNWRGRRYRISELGMRYPVPSEDRYAHRFTFAVDGTAFELEFNAKLLTWRLIKISDGNSD